MFINPSLEIAGYIDPIADALRGDGWLVVPDFLPSFQCDALRADCESRRAEFAEAAIGRGSARQHSSDQRSDATLWLRDICTESGNETNTAQHDFLQAMDCLRNELNRRLFMGLRDYEAHYAHYAPGAFYRRHRDAFAATHAIGRAPQRILSSVFYLNTCARGGELTLYSSENESLENARDEHELACIAPVAGTAVFFLSAEFPHAVLPAQSDRYSIAGWFRA